MLLFTESRYKIITHNRRGIKRFFLGKKGRRRGKPSGGQTWDRDRNDIFAFHKKKFASRNELLFLDFGHYSLTQKETEVNYSFFMAVLVGCWSEWREKKLTDGNLFNKRLVLHQQRL